MKCSVHNRCIVAIQILEISSITWLNKQKKKKSKPKTVLNKFINTSQLPFFFCLVLLFILWYYLHITWYYYLLKVITFVFIFNVLSHVLFSNIIFNVHSSGCVLCILTYCIEFTYYYTYTIDSIVQVTKYISINVHLRLWWLKTTIRFNIHWQWCSSIHFILFLESENGREIQKLLIYYGKWTICFLYYYFVNTYLVFQHILLIFNKKKNKK